MDNNRCSHFNVTFTVSLGGNISSLFPGFSRPTQPKVVGMKSQVSLRDIGEGMVSEVTLAPTLLFLDPCILPLGT